MKLTFLGAGASEGIPAVWCNCALCNGMRKEGRRFTRSQLLVDGDLLLDWPPDTYVRALHAGVDLSAIRDVLITHSHCDHFYHWDFFARGRDSAYAPTVPLLTVWGSETIAQIMARDDCGVPLGTYRDGLPQGTDAGASQPLSAQYALVHPYRTFFAGAYEVTPLPAVHIPGEACYVYTVSRGGKRFLYATDTEMPDNEVFEFLARDGRSFDAVIYDATYGALDKTEGHMNFSAALAFRERLTALGLCDGRTQHLLTHLSHNVARDPEELRRSIPNGFLAAEDGLTVML